MKKVRVLMCGSKRTEKGGMSSVINQLMEHDWGNNIEITYLSTHISGHVITKCFYFFKSYLHLFMLSIQNTYDIIHIHMSYKGSFIRKNSIAHLSKKFSKKVIVHLHGSEFKDYYNQSSYKNKVKIQKFFSLVDVTIVLGNDWNDFIRRIAPRANIVVVNNAIKIPEYHIQIRHTPFTLLFLGVLIERKGVFDLLKAIKSIIKQSYNIKLYIAGTGLKEKEMREYCLNNGLKDNVEFLGWVSNAKKEKVFLNSDLLVLPSYNEGLPIAILEALSYGLPIISTNVGSISDAVINKRNGLLISPGNVEELKNGILNIYLSYESWKYYSTQSRIIAEERFSEALFFEKIKKLYLDK